MKEYRINGFEQIKAFYSWVFNNPDKARPTHVSLYLFLLNQANRSNWAEWFKCPYDLAMQGACIGNNGTYYKCLDELKEWKLIDYHKGVNNYKAPLIHLFCLYDSEQVSEQVTVPLSEQVSEQQTVQLTEQVTVHIYNVLTSNIKRITDNIDDVIKFLDSKENKKTVIYSEQAHSLYSDLIILFEEKLRPDTEAKKNKWLDVCEKLLKSNTPDHIKQVVKRARMDDFWGKQFLSLAKLGKSNKDDVNYFTVFENQFCGQANKSEAKDKPYIDFGFVGDIKDLK